MHAYGKLPEAKKDKIRGILFIMDKYSISWEAYPELPQWDQTPPRSYLLQGCLGTTDSS